MKNIFTVFILGAVLFLCGCSANKDKSVKIDHTPDIVINGTSVGASAAVLDNCLYIPVREVFGGLNFKINFDVEEKSVEVIDVDSSNVISPMLKFDSEKITYFNSEHDEQRLSGHIRILDDAAYVPLFRLSDDGLTELADYTEESGGQKKRFLFFGGDDTSDIGNSFNSEPDTLADGLRDNFGMTIKWDAVSDSLIISTNSGSYDADAAYTSAEGINDFAFELNEKMPNDKNYVFSPMALKYSLAMAANGADADTMANITDKLGITNLDAFNKSVGASIQRYNDEQSKSVLKLSNSIWLNDDTMPGAEFSPEFKDIAQRLYFSAIENVDNTTALDTMNSWCMTNSDYNIYNLTDDSDFLTCLASMVYFKTYWKDGFLWANTKYDVFNERNGGKNYVGYMSNTGEYKYAADEDVKMLAMPLAEDSICVYFVLSGDRQFDFEKYLDSLKTQKVRVEIPKFNAQYSNDITGMLCDIGMESSFGSDAVFDNMLSDGEKKLNSRISRVIHKVYFTLDENGNYDKVDLNYANSNDKGAVTFRADKPFTYIVRDNSNGEILLMGEYAFAQQ